MFNQELIQKKFKEIGAPVRFEEFDARHRGNSNSLPVEINVETSRKNNEQFVIRYRSNREFELEVMDHRPTEKHLLLLLRTTNSSRNSDPTDRPSENIDIVKILCGHDERHYFTCGVPDKAKVSTVDQARQALKPDEILRSEQRAGLKTKDKKRRKTKGYIRQGEWFFIPLPGFTPKNKRMIRLKEPISRGRGSNPHIVERLYFEGGETVYVHPHLAPTGISERKMKELQSKRKAQELSEAQFEVRTRNARVYAYGYVRHPDHKTIILPFWHEVMMNTESQSKAAPVIAFLD